MLKRQLAKALRAIVNNVITHTSLYSLWKINPSETSFYGSNGLLSYTTYSLNIDKINLFLPFSYLS